MLRNFGRTTLARRRREPGGRRQPARRDIIRVVNAISAEQRPTRIPALKHFRAFLIKTLRIPLRGAPDRQCQPFGAREGLHFGHGNHLASGSAQHHHMRVVGPATELRLRSSRGTAVLVHRKQLSGRPHVRQLGGSESTGAPMCDRVNATYKKYIRAVPRELFAVERLHLKPLPAWIPEVYRLHQRTVDVEGYVSVNSIRYSVPVSWIGRRVEVRETRDKIEIELDARHLVTHVHAVTPQSQRITLAEHRPPRGEGVHAAIRTPRNKPSYRPRRRSPGT